MSDILELEVTRLLIAQMHSRRVSVAKIAETLKVSPSEILAILTEIYKEQALPVLKDAIIRDLQLIDDAIEVVFPRVVAGTRGAVADLDKLLSRRAKILGLDAPTRVDATVFEVTQEDIALQDMIRQAKLTNRDIEQNVLRDRATG